MSKLSKFKQHALTPFQLTKLTGGSCDHYCTVTWASGASTSGYACGASAAHASNALFDLYSEIASASGGGAAFSVSC